MNRFVLWHLAVESLKKNYRISLPFLGGSILMAAMIYSMTSLAFSPDLASSYGGMTMQTVLKFGLRIIEIFALIFYFYLNSVWNRSRQKENGLLTVLGMEKKHLIQILLIQMLICAAAAIVGGIVLGIVLDQIMFLLILKLIGLQPVFDFSISLTGLQETAPWTMLCYALIFIWSAIDMLRKNPLELMKSTRSGEQRIKNRWILAILGVLSLGAGYWMALSVDNPITAMALFFIAVIFVIIGTYLLFMFGSTVLVQLLQKNKRYYYKPAHFISVSTMRYRLKQNAAALANIAILSTMVLVTLSTTISLIAGVDQFNQTIFARDIKINVGANEEINTHPETILNQVMASAQKAGLEPSDPLAYSYAIESFNTSDHQSVPFIGLIVSPQTYERITGQKFSVEPGKYIAFSPAVQTGQRLLDPETGKEFGIIESVQSDFSRDFSLPFGGVTDQVWMIGDTDQLPNAAVRGMIQFNSSNPHLLDDAQNSGQVVDPLWKDLQNSGLNTDGMMISSREADRQDMIVSYSSILFIGVYISALFMLAVILIMYYKQISEGLEDQNRFRILQNVGLEAHQIRKVINDQVLLMFFLPLGTALVHILFAYPMINKIMNLLLMPYSWLFLTVTLISFAIFAIIYIVIYRLTARTFYRLTLNRS